MLRLFFYLILATTLISAQTGIIRGTVKDEQTKTKLQHVNIFVQDFRLGTTSDKNGNYTLTNIPLNEKIILSFSHLGYQIYKTEIVLKEDITLDVSLVSQNIPLGEVSVSSSRYDKMLKDNPLPLEVMQKEEMEKINAITLADFLQNESGVSLRRDGIWGTDISIRGLSKDNVVTLIDGNRIETATEIAASLSLIDVNDIERVEIIKGASSSLYGTGALGVVNIISRESNYSNNFFLNGSVQSVYNSVNKGMFSSLNLLTGGSSWHLKFTTSYRTADNTETPQGELSNSHFHDNNISALFSLRTFDNQELKINYQRSRANDVGIPGSSAFPVTADVRYPEEKRDLFSINYSFQNISQSLLKINLRYFYQYILRDVENIPHIVRNVPASGNTPPRRVSVLSITPTANHIMHGIQAQSDFNFGNHYLIAGIDYWQRAYRGEREKSQLVEALNPETNEVVSITNIIIGEQALPNADYASAGIYVQDEIKVQDNFRITIGGRFDKIFIDNEIGLNPVYQITNGVRNDTPNGQVVIWDESSSENTSWSANVSLLYNVIENFDLTFSASRSFRSPTLEERYQYIDQGSYVRLGNPELSPEDGYFFDLGVRNRDHNFSFRGNIFLNLMNNLVVEEPGSYEGREAFIKTNIGEARLYGFDLSCQYLLAEKLKLFTTMAYVRGEDIKEDKNLPLISPLNGTLGISLPILDLSEVMISSTLYAEQNDVAEGEKTTPGYAVFNLYLSSKEIYLGSISFNVYAGVENIADKSYRNHLATNRSFITAEPGRNFYLKLKMNW